MIKKISEYDLSELIIKKIAALDNDYKKAILASIITCLVGYAFQLTHVVMSPDMYFEVVTGSSYKINVSGRWFMAFLRNIVLGDHRIVPTFNFLLALTFFFFSALIVAKLWRITRPLHLYLVVTVITINTYTNHILRWENANIEAAFTTFMAILALYLSGRGWRLYVVGLILMTCAHGSYQTGIAMSAAVLFAGLAFWIYQDGNLLRLNYYIKNKILPAISIFVAGFVFHKIILSTTMNLLGLEKLSRLKQIHIPKNLYEVLDNIGLAISSIPPLFSSQVVYFNSQITSLLYLLFGLYLLAIVSYVTNKPSWQKAIIALIVIGLSFVSLLSTFLPTIVVGYMGITNRILFPVSIFYILVILVILSSTLKPIVNIGVVSSFCLLFFFAWHNNMYAYRSYLQDRADFNLAGRIISKIENHPDYTKYYARPLKLAVIGTKNISLHGYRFSSSPYQKIMNMGAFQQAWSAEGIFNYFHFPHTSVRNGELTLEDVNENVAKKMVSMEEWPSDKFVDVVDGVALVMMSKAAIPQNAAKILFRSKDVAEAIIIQNDWFRPNSQFSRNETDGTYVSTGIDPFVFFKISQPDSNKIYLLHSEIHAPSATMAQLFFKTKVDPRWTQKQSVKCSGEEKEYSCYFYLDGDDITGELRLDPGTIPGKYFVSDIEIRAIFKEDI